MLWKTLRWNNVCNWDVFPKSSAVDFNAWKIIHIFNLILYCCETLKYKYTCPPCLACKMCIHRFVSVNYIFLTDWNPFSFSFLFNERNLYGMFNHLNLHQSAVRKCSLQFEAHMPVHNFLTLTSDCFFRETWHRALYMHFVHHQTTHVYERCALVFVQLEEMSNAFPCLLNYIFPSFDIITLAAWVNNNRGSDFFPF